MKNPQDLGRRVGVFLNRLSLCFAAKKPFLLAGQGQAPIYYPMDIDSQAISIFHPLKKY
jgi:hypothetical protein